MKGLVGGLFGAGGAAMGADAAASAASQQRAAGREANDMQWKMFQQQRQDQDPYRQAGVSALYGAGGLFRRKDGGSGMAPANDAARNKFISDFMSKHTAERDAMINGAPEMLREQLRGQATDDMYRTRAEQAWMEQPGAQAGANAGADQYEIDPEFTRNFSNADFVKDPGYDFRMQEGQKALERSAAARGGLQSGGTMKALAKYGQDYASNEYGNAYNRFNADRDRRFGRLSSLAGMGQNAANQMGVAGQNYANQAGANTMGAANASGAAGMASANAWGQALGGIGRGINDSMASQQQQKWMDQWLTNQRATAGGASYPFAAKMVP
jgi:hypothetical protein